MLTAKKLTGKNTPSIHSENMPNDNMDVVGGKGSDDLERQQTLSGGSHSPNDLHTIKPEASLSTDSIDYPLSNPRKYGLLALFASALAIDGESTHDTP